MTRASGILMHITSLPGPFGIGTFGNSAYEFVDFLKETGQSYWQILPLGPTSFGDSPYQSFSAFAGNSLLIDFDLLADNDLLKAEDYQHIDYGDDPKKVDYERVSAGRRDILEKAVNRFLIEENLENYHLFIGKNKNWLEPYAKFMTLKKAFDGRPWWLWPEEYQDARSESCQNLFEQQTDEIEYHQVVQYFFHLQWERLKLYGNDHGISIIGDMPIYIAADSVELWHQPELFQVDERGRPHHVAGVPPDAFSEDGQLWGNPLYDWDHMKENNYAWWVQRLEMAFQLYDIVRIDHFRGFAGYWSVPANSETAKDGQWIDGPRYDFFEKVVHEMGALEIIAEDLGVITPDVEKLLEQCGFPGMRILQFAFDGSDSQYLPHNHEPNAIVYVGTHDNDTALGWYGDLPVDQQHEVDHYIHRHSDESAAKALNRAAASSTSDTVIYMMQDLLELGSEARMNMPSTIGDNWDWRMLESDLTEAVKAELLQLTKTYFRMPTHR